MNIIDHFVQLHNIELKQSIGYLPSHLKFINYDEKYFILGLLGSLNDKGIPTRQGIKNIFGRI